MNNVVGSIYSGVVVLKEQNSYLVDIGIGSDAILNSNEAERELNEGDVIDVIVAYYSKEDYFVSMKGVTRKKRLEEIASLIGTEQTVSAKVIAYKNKRFIVDLGDNVKGSVYVKNMDVKYIEDGSPYVNQTYDFLVVDKTHRNYEDFDLNRRDLLNEQLKSLREDFVGKYTIDQVVKAKVKEVMKVGLILDVDNTELFVPHSEIAHYAIKDEDINVGDEYDVKITEVQERSLSLKGSIKALIEHPFTKAANLKVDDVIKGKITKIMDYGLFVELFEHVEGLVHISEVSYEHTKDLSNFEINQEIEVKVIDINLDKHRIALSIKKLLPSPYEQLKEKIQVGDTISVLVKRITENGIRVKVMDDFYTTIINEDIYDFSKMKPTFRINDRLEVIVMELDDEHEKIALSNNEFVKKEYELLEQSI